MRDVEELRADVMRPKRLCVAIIPCKMTSKRLPRKNLRLVAGIPMVLHALMKAKSCPFIDMVVVSTDNVEELQKELPQLKSSLFEDVYLVQRSGALCQPETPIYLIVQDALQILARARVIDRSITHLVMLQPNVPTLPHEAVDLLVEAVVVKNYNVARHFNTSGAMTGGCDAYKFPAFQSAQLMDTYNFGFMSPDLEIHTEEDLVMAEQVFKMREVEANDHGPT
jgi:N-acylneuraminate cytidylyltransferase